MQSLLMTSSPMLQLTPKAIGGSLNMYFTPRLLALLALLATLTRPQLAQSNVASAYQLSPQGQAVVQRLSSFASLDARDWQYHEGPIEHGERPNLDTSNWKTVHLPFTAPKEEIWLRRWIEVPKTLDGYDLTGTRITLKVDVGGYGPGRGYLYEMIYYNGYLDTEGTYIGPRTLIEDAKPGDKILIAVKMPPSTEIKHFEGAFIHVNFRANRPDPTALAAELASAAQILPVLITDPNQRAAQEKLLDSAATAVNLRALDRNDQAAFDASLNEAQNELEPLRPLLKKFLIQLTGDAHIDAAWLWTASEGVDQVHFTFANAIEMMHEYPQYIFSQSSAQYYEWMEQKFPALFAEIQQRVKEGRWEPVGGMWVEPDLNMTDGESQVRQLLLGKQYFKKKFNFNVKIGWNVDSFGYNWQLPQIYKKSGIDYFVTQKLRYNDTNQLPLKLFWWHSPDGSRVLSYFPHDIVQDTEVIEMANDVAVANQLNPGQQELMHVYGPSLGRLNLYDARTAVQNGILWSNTNRIYPRVEFRTSQAFFDDMISHISTTALPVWNYKTLAKGSTQLPAPAAGKIGLPVWNDEIYLEHHRGTYTTQSTQKANMRHSDQWLLDAEKYSSLAWLGGLSYPGDSFTQAWKKKAFNEFHDVASGTAIAAAYKDAQHDYDEVHRIANEATGNALRELQSHINTAAQPGVPIIVWNSLSWDRSDTVTAAVQMPQATPNGITVLDASGQPVPMQMLSHDMPTNTYHLLLKPKSVPAIGYTVLHAVPGRRDVVSDLTMHGTTLENSFLRVTLDPKTGCITSLYRKDAKFESIAPGQCGNQLETFVDTGRSLTEANLDSIRVEDAWNIDKEYSKQETDITQFTGLETVEHGPLREVIRITRHWSQSTFVQDITLYANTPRVDVVNDIDWHETHILLKASFPLTATSSTATYEIPYGSIERPTTRDNPIDAARFEVPAQRWADLGDNEHGFSLINDSKYGYDALGNTLRLSMLRAPLYPDPTADRGHHHFSYSLYPHAASWKQADTVLRAYEFNYPMKASQTDSHTGDLPANHSLVRIASHNLVMTAIKKSEDDDSLILRFYEWAGEKTRAKITVPAGATQAVETNLMEQSVTDSSARVVLHGNEVDFDASPYSINTLRLVYPSRGSHAWHEINPQQEGK
ncbi:glycoside hydrolase family 38 C-terminal domain-containing protein [Edaphobacter paludis]|uniref:Glycoside hydrolase family 38 C-terminal domain-containing protein n=1 Tax=Edaphobacter paludis TaxID=3035702 RepID=A0AAU7CYI0_9BACT